MRVVTLTPKARHVFVGKNPGILVENECPVKIGDEIISANFFLPFVNCDIIKYDQYGSYNSDQFMVLNHVSLFKSEKGGIVLAPSGVHDDYVLLFCEICDSKSQVIPKYGGPELLHRIEFDEGIESNLFMLVLRKDTAQTVFSFNSNDDVLEYSFLFDYNASEVGMKCRKLPV